MATAFSESESKTIRTRLKTTGREYLVRYGLRKTTVEQLAQAAGISTGAFYRFYESKELLFFEIIEDMHECMYERGMQILTTRKDLPQAERMELAFSEFFAQLSELGISDVWASDMDLLLRKIPENILKNHWTDDTSHIRDLIEHSGLKLTVGTEEAAAIVHALANFLACRKNFTDGYFEKTLTFMIRAVSRTLDAEARNGTG